MKCCTSLLVALSVVFGMSVRAGAAQDAPARDAVSLDGVWNFATDPDNRGEAEKWQERAISLPQMPLPGYSPEAEGTICVPGIWDNQGYGVETDKVRHHFVGKGWYKRSIETPPQWAGRRMFLVITGASRYSKTWINGHFLGEHVGYLSQCEYDVTPYITPGKTATLAIQIDSEQRWNVDSLAGAASLIDGMYIAWGGIWGHVRLEARADAWLSDLFLQPDVSNSTCKATVAIQGRTDVADAVKLEVFDSDGGCVADARAALKPESSPASQPAGIDVTIPNARLWSPESPTLYRAKLCLLKGSDVIDALESRFGMRQFSIDGYHILLNGKRILLRGYGDDHIYSEQMAMPSDKNLYLDRLRVIKAYGFNAVRHHSTMMPPEYFDACDELGMITTTELSIPYEAYIPGTGDIWKKNVPPGTDPKPATDTYYREWASVIRQCRNHPCIMYWVMGNELYQGFPTRRASPYEIAQTLCDIAHQLDPTRTFVDSDGSDDGILSNPKSDRPTAAAYHVQFGEWTDPIMNVDKFKMAKPIKPVLSHESGNYVTFSRPDLTERIRDNIKPFWLTDGRAKLEKMGLLGEANAWAEKSERLYTLLHKYNLELLRKTPYLSGYHWWLIQDYWTTSNGLVDHTFRPKSMTPQEVRNFNNDVVLLQDGLQRTYRAQTRLQLRLLVSNFSSGDLRGDLTYAVKAGDRTLFEHQSSSASAAQGDLADIAAVDETLPEVQAPTQLTIAASLKANGRLYENDWKTWLYPAVIAPQNVASPIFADASKAQQFSAWGARPLPAAGELPAHAVYLTGDLDSRAADAVRRGASAILFDGAGRCEGKSLADSRFECTCVPTLNGGPPVLKPYALTFRTSWWAAGESREENSTGTFVYDHPWTKAMAPDGWCDEGWWYLLDGACKFDLEQAASRPDVYLRALPSLKLPTDEAVMFEVGVGRGCLLVSGLNHRQAAERPENAWILAKLIERAAMFPQPKAQWPISFLKAAGLASDANKKE